ncbi:hypothetical protein BLOT_010697 [Blomia tropicalis]|nr:hypothetical protein BLOT_010697 [Blomia tropicalis]
MEDGKGENGNKNKIGTFWGLMMMLDYSKAATCILCQPDSRSPKHILFIKNQIINYHDNIWFNCVALKMPFQ